MAAETYARIYTVVAAIPAGKVCTYGQVAELAEMPRAARQVGYALAALKGKNHQVPWWRVLNAKGEVSVRTEAGQRENLQQQLLEAEGVEFDVAGRVNLKLYRWQH